MLFNGSLNFIATEKATSNIPACASKPTVSAEDRQGPTEERFKDNLEKSNYVTIHHLQNNCKSKCVLLVGDIMSIL